MTTNQDLRMLIPIDVTDAALVSSNVPENDHDAWDAGITYALNDYVIHNHGVWISASAGNVANEPAAGSAFWTRVSATNRWKAFDQVIAHQVENEDSISYTIHAQSTINGIALFNLRAATIRVTSDNGGDSGEIALVDTSAIVDVWSYFTWDGNDYDDELIVQSVVGFPGDKLTITLTGTGAVKVGQIILGRMYSLGVATAADMEIEDYSVTEYDDFGSVTLIERSFSRTTTFAFVVPKSLIRRVRRKLSAQRAKPAVFTGAEDSPEFGSMIYGWPSDWSIPADGESVAFATLQVSGLQE